MLVFAHPDDEVLALGGRLTRFREAHLVHVTDGAPEDEQESLQHGFSSRKAYRDARWKELSLALTMAGITSISRECLCYADQSASFFLAELTEKIKQRIAQHQPEVLFTHPYEGGHPDHDACAFAVHHATRRCNANVVVIEAPFYHLSTGGIRTGAFLAAREPVVEEEFLLSPEERTQKRKLLGCFRTQQQMLCQFSTERERYRIAPAYDFTQPPHAPPLFYDHFGWGITSDRFCRLAQQAESLLYVETR